MADIRQELIDMMNDALKLEHAARIQYLSHAEMIKGLNSEKLVERIKEIASDELKHEEKFRTMIGAYLGGVPTMEMSKTYGAKEDPSDILTVNLRQEKHAIDFYKQIYRKVMDNRPQLQYVAEVLEHEIRHVIKDEQEHVAEISQLLGVEVQEKVREMAKAGV